MPEVSYVVARDEASAAVKWSHNITVPSAAEAITQAESTSQMAFCIELDDKGLMGPCTVIGGTVEYKAQPASIQRVIDLLKTELQTVGGKLFAQGMVDAVTEAQADSGDGSAIRSLKTTEFVNNLFDIRESTSEDEQYFMDLLTAISLIQTHYKGTRGA